eukprot:GHVP01014761.1.p1 GENE.GHVP01014761.1~~GHVP01014761.1.p1  ORF type:complete len:609 (+),score=101.34 GHVP01014761.1:1149-2975(+)
MNKGTKSKNKSGDNQRTRIAIVDQKKCKPNKCNLECQRVCPVNKVGKMCIDVFKTSKISNISEVLCIGCGICTKRCPFQAIRIINLPSNLEDQTTHRYSANSFKLHRLPVPRAGQVLGLVGTNGIGKSTALKILGGVKPNLGNFENPPDWEQVLKKFRGSELQSYFTKQLEDKIKAVIKPQFVEQIARMPSIANKKIGDVLKSGDERGKFDEIVKMLNLSAVLDRKVSELSGGELQRFVIGVSCLKEASVYMFDEPSSYLDIKQRLEMARCIRSLISSDKYVIVVEHDLCVLDYLSDYACLFYGEAGVYGVVSFPYSIREAINNFLSGWIPTDNVRFRDSELVFRQNTLEDTLEENRSTYNYSNMTKKYNGFTLDVESGNFSNSEITILLGENGTGKTTFIKMLAGIEGKKENEEIPELVVSYKPQTLGLKTERTVREIMLEQLGNFFGNSQFIVDIVKPLGIEGLYDNTIKTLSGGELQRVSIAICLGRSANIYLIDEPSAYLDAEQRLSVGKIIRRFIVNNKKTAFVVEHDFIMATYLADRIIVYSGTPGVHGIASKPQSVVDGMNTFLKNIGVTFRKERGNLRPRVNKEESVKDREQKEKGDYWY